ncbi:MAG: M64 family metallopeptidase, partial [Chitinophagales bacterium]
MRQFFLSILLFILQFSLNAQNCDDTSVLLQSQTQDWGVEMSWTIINSMGEEIAVFMGTENNQTAEEEVCLIEGCYTLIAEDVYGDGWNGGSLTITIEGGETIEYSLNDGRLERFAFGIGVEGCEPTILGCTDSQALNYNPEANFNDGTCTNLPELIAGLTLDTVFYHGPKDNRINWVIQNRGVANPSGNFSSREELIELLEADLVKAFTNGDPTAQIPYAQYQNFFNLYASWWEDAPSDQEWWNFGIIKQMRDELFLPWGNDETGWVSWFSTTKNGGGGGAGLERDRRVGDAKIFGMGYETFLHEFGHTMPGLLDEYSASGEWSGGQCWETPNTTGNTDIDEIPWRLWIEEGTPLPTPYTEEYLDKYGAFEGGLTNFFGCHRPSARGCYMGAGGFGEGFGTGLCGPCRQRVICFLYKYVNVIENPQPAQSELEVTGSQTLTFSAEVLKPEPNTQKYEWFLNGKLIAEGVEELEVTFGACDAYELTFAVTDTNTLVRYDPKFEETYPKPYREFTWNIEQSDVESYNLMAQAATQNLDCTGEINGQIAFEAGGGLPPYSIFLEGKEVGSPINFLEAGEYIFDIVDGNGCSISQTVILQSDALLEPQLCTAYENGAWNLWVETPNYDINSLTFSWSNGETGAAIEGLASGNYSVEITTANNCSLTEFISLNNFEEGLTVTEKAIATEVGKESGQIHLDIQGGLSP